MVTVKEADTLTIGLACDHGIAVINPPVTLTK
jgi:hypothetical protein